MTKVFIDTNYLLRLLVNDNPTQFQKVRQLFQDALDNPDGVELCTSVIVFFEVKWVLASFYQTDKTALVAKLEQILDLVQLEIENTPLLYKALELFGMTNLQLEDCYHLAYVKFNQVDVMATFDEKLNKKSQQFLKK